MILWIKWKYIVMFSILFFSAPLSMAEENVTLSQEQNSSLNNLCLEKLGSKIIIGETEHVRLVPPDIVLEARIDTGAKTTSIDARNITPFERDGKKWVRFVCVTGENEHIIERKIIKSVLIKGHNKEAQRRYVVDMRLILGEVSQLVPVTLSDRSKYEYPILIGRNFLHDFFIVDVAKKNQFKPVALPE